MPRRFLRAIGIVSLAGLIGFAILRPAAGQKESWGTALKGSIVWNGDIPQRVEIAVPANHAPACGNAILNEDIIVNPKNKGVQNALVWLAPQPGKDSLPVHPDRKEVPKDPVLMDQPKCMFVPRVSAVREGQKVLFKNSAAVAHNVRGQSLNQNNNFNVNLPPNGQLEKSFQTANLPILQVNCDLHPWMSARIGVFNHPYFAVTDENGNFEIKQPPAGKYRLKVWHEHIGWRGGVAGRDGEEITIQGGGPTDLKQLKIGKAGKK